MSLRRWWCVLLLALAGCQPSHNPNAITLRIATWGTGEDDSDYAKKCDAIDHEFERENPGVKIVRETIPEQYVQAMVMAHVAGASPDIMMLDASSAAVFMNNGIVTDLAPIIAKDPEFRLDDYFPNVVDIARRGSAVYAIPQDFTPMVMYYNKRLFDRAQVPYPDGSWNFERFRQVARAVTINEGEKNERFGYAFSNWMPGWVMWLWNNGGDVLTEDGTRAAGSLNSPQNAQTFRFLRDLIEVDHVSPSPSMTAAMGVDPFVSGRAAMTISGHWSLIDYKNAPKDRNGQPKLDWRELGVTAVPHNTPLANTVMYESGYAIPTGCRHLDLAWRYVKYMTSRRVQMDYNSSGIAIDARKDVAQARAVDPLERAFLPLVATARAPRGSRVEGYDFVETQGASAMSSVLLNGADPLAALKTAAERIDLEFAKR
ncbi:MAG TPA: sugar ABC transporter substrate-binding protein [Fimbriimonadaceae bacterium]|nr:sugar ABC transporter substrate-binding protein [Fimbriimonadaceae bacterium]